MNSIERFWSKVNKLEGDDACWLWTSQLRAGYGIFRLGDKVVSAHRFSYSLEHDLEPSLQVCHKCDTPACVRPSHLFQGTAKANSDDKWNKDRGNGVLTNKQVEEIRSREYTDTILREVCEEFGVPEQVARNAMTGRTFAFLPGARPLPRQKSKRILTDAAVEEIKIALETPRWGIMEKLATKYGVSRHVIYRIKTGTY